MCSVELQLFELQSSGLPIKCFLRLLPYGKKMQPKLCRRNTSLLEPIPLMAHQSAWKLGSYIMHHVKVKLFGPKKCDQILVARTCGSQNLV